MGQPITAEKFVEKWSNADLRERAGAHSHFNDLCAMLGEKTPTDADPKGEWYAFERGVTKTGGGEGWADVWKRGCFAWEYKSPGKNLDTALKQLKLYASDLENPPLLIVSDMQQFRIHTNWTSMVQETHELRLEDLADARLRQKLKWAFSDATVHELKPKRSANATTEEVAKDFVRLAQNLRDRGHDPEKVAHFVNRMVFCMFAEDVDLLPKKMFEQMLRRSLEEPDNFTRNAEQLFAAMANKDGMVGFDRIEWFNGGLFEDNTALPLTREDIRVALDAADKNWSEINPSIMGTLFERGLDPGKRSQLGAHYTDAEKIMMIVRPVIIEPLLREWDTARTEIAALMETAKTHKTKGERTKAANAAREIKSTFIERLKNFRVLDPACGSGNFLYLALKALKDIEYRVNFEAETLGLEKAFPSVGPECVKGIEINPFAAELARVSVWIGEIQWMREHNYSASRNPILKSLETIECRDALLNPDGSEAEWPEADVIIGNPPFLGDRRMIGVLGENYVSTLRNRYSERVPGGADLVCYWFAKSNESTDDKDCDRVGLVSTNSIRGGANRVVLDNITVGGQIFDAWADEPWVVDGAAVRVSLVCFSKQDTRMVRLDGQPVAEIHSDLTAPADVSGPNLTRSVPLVANSRVAFIGSQKNGPFDVSGDTARKWLDAPVNPNGRRNSEVVRPWTNGTMIVGDRFSDRWIVDFGNDMSESDAALFEQPFKHVQEHVKPTRLALRRKWHREKWWLHGDPRPALKRSVAPFSRFLVTPRVAKHRIFVWRQVQVLPDSATAAIARDDDTTFGILHSKFHELWSLRMCTWLGVGNDPRYTPTTCFETFPFPEGLTPNIPASQYAADPRAMAIAKAAARLNELRENWLNPPDLVMRVPEVVPGYPDRILPVDDKAAAILKNRTLTKLYNERPAWLDHAHKDLDAAVAAAYGWPDDLTDEQILEKLFALNQERAAKQ